jgi:hypothetical protein
MSADLAASLRRLAEGVVRVIGDLQGPCGHTLGTVCLGCDHATHHGSACLARVIAASGGEEMCRCRFDEETSTQAPERCGHRPEDGQGLACTLDDLHPSSVLHADDLGNAWSS